MSDLKFKLLRICALLFYTFRKRKYFNQLYPVAWRSQAKLMADDIKFIAEVEGAETVGEEFIDALVSGRKEARKRITRFSTVSTICTIYLLLSALSIDIQISVFGFSLKPLPGVNEFLLAGLVVYTFYSLPFWLNTFVLGYGIKAAIAETFPPSLYYFHERRVFVEEYPFIFRPQFSPRFVWTKGLSVIANFMILYLVMLVCCILAAFVLSRYLIYTHVLSNPSFPDFWSTAVVYGSLCVDCVSIIIICIFMVPLPHRNYALSEEIDVLSHLNTKTALIRMSEATRRQRADERLMIRKGYIREK